MAGSLVSLGVRPWDETLQINPLFQLLCLPSTAEGATEHRGCRQGARPSLLLTARPTP